MLDFEYAPSNSRVMGGADEPQEAIDDELAELRKENVELLKRIDKIKGRNDELEKKFFELEEKLRTTATVLMNVIRIFAEER